MKKIYDYFAAMLQISAQAKNVFLKLEFLYYRLMLGLKKKIVNK